MFLEYVSERNRERGRREKKGGGAEIACVQEYQKRVSDPLTQEELEAFISHLN